MERKGEGWVMEEMKCGRKGCKVNIKRKTTVFISACMDTNTARMV